MTSHLLDPVTAAGPWALLVVSAAVLAGTGLLLAVVAVSLHRWCGTHDVPAPWQHRATSGRCRAPSDAG